MLYDLAASFLITKLQASGKNLVPYYYLKANFDMELTKENLGNLAVALSHREEVADVFSDAIGFHVALYSEYKAI